MKPEIKTNATYKLSHDPVIQVLILKDKGRNFNGEQILVGKFSSKYGNHGVREIAASFLTN